MIGLLSNHRAARAAHIASQFVVSEPATGQEEFKKGIVDEFRYGKTAEITQIKKTGKEIKEALREEYELLSGKEAAAKARMAVLVEKIGFEPTQESQHYRIENYRLKDIPKNYDVYNTKEQLSAAYTSQEDIDVLCRLMYEYNDYAYKLIDLCVQCKMINTLIKNIDDKKTYLLSLELTTMLGL